MRKEFKSEEINPVELIKTQIWSMFDILRIENISTEDYDVILFLLSTFNDGLIKADILLNSYQMKDILISNLKNSENEWRDQYLSKCQYIEMNMIKMIVQTFETIIIKMSNRGLTDIVHILMGISKKVLSENYHNIYDSVLYRISQSQGRYGGVNIQPVELTRFICDLANLKPNSSVYNPFAGLASFGVYLDQEHNYFGQELNQKTWALGALRLMAFERTESSSYVVEDSILNWPDSDEKFDLILSSPPFGLRLQNQIESSFGRVSSIEHFLIEKGLESLKPNGKMILHLSQGFLYKNKESEKNIRKYLVENDLLEMVISLPNGILKNMAITTSIIVINKNKIEKGKIQFLNANRFVEYNTSKDKKLNDSELIKAIKENKDFDVIRLISNETVFANSFNLNVHRYFRFDLVGVKLSDICTVIRSTKNNEIQKGKFVRIRDLKDDKLDFQLEVENIEVTDLPRNVQYINESCVILALRWKKIKPTLFTFNGTPIYLTNDAIAIKLDEKKVDAFYLGHL
jgi:type I restriction enzyme M protein